MYDFPSLGRWAMNLINTTVCVNTIKLHTPHLGANPASHQCAKPDQRSVIPSPTQTSCKSCHRYTEMHSRYLPPPPHQLQLMQRRSYWVQTATYQLQWKSCEEGWWMGKAELVVGSSGLVCHLPVISPHPMTSRW